MRKLLQLAALLALTGAATTHAQITSPDTLVAPPPRNPAHAAAQPAEDFQWLWQYTKPAPNGQKSTLLADPRFKTLLKDHLQTPQAFWGNNLPLSEAASTFLAGEGRVISVDNRYLAISGCVVDHCQQTGLLWIDLGSPNPLIVFVAKRWSEHSKTADEAGALFDLWLFPDRNLDPPHLPKALTEAIGNWIGRNGGVDCPGQQQPQHIGAAITVDLDGTPHVSSASQAGFFYTICTSTTVS